MRMQSERSKPLHNFMLPCLKWGNQKHLRCMKVNSNGVQVSGAIRHSHSSRSEESTESRMRESASEMRMFLNDLETRPKFSKSRNKKTDEDDGIEAVREKLMFDLKTAADKMKQTILSKEAAVVVREEAEAKKSDSAGVQETPAAVAPSMAEARPWNLRTRRAACKAPNVDGGGSKNLKIDEKKSNSDSSRLKIEAEKKKKRKAKLVIPLSKREIDEDFMVMLGLKPPKRPKKRTRIVQRQLDTVFPGLWLSEITADLYEVPELPAKGKVMKV